MGDDYRPRSRSRPGEYSLVERAPQSTRGEPDVRALLERIAAAEERNALFLEQLVTLEEARLSKFEQEQDRRNEEFDRRIDSLMQFRVSQRTTWQTLAVVGAFVVATAALLANVLKILGK